MLTRVIGRRRGGGGGGPVTPVTLPKVIGAFGFTGSNYIRSPIGTLTGGLGRYTIVGLVRMGPVQVLSPDPQTIVSSGNRFNEGYALLIQNDRLQAETTNSGTKFSVFGPRWWEAAGSGLPAQWSFLDWKTAVFSLRADHINSPFPVGPWMQFHSNEFGTDTPYTPSTDRMWIGRQTNGFDHLRGALCALGYVEDRLTDDQMIATVREIKEENDIVDSGGYFENLYSFRQMGLVHGDPIPSVVTDFGPGGIDLECVGSLSADESTPFQV